MFHCPFHSCLSHIRTGSLYVSPFFSPLLLRRGFVVVCFEVIKGESLCHSAYAMWSRGSWLGDPWFPHGVVLLLSPVCMALCVSVFPCLLCFLAFGHTRMWWHNARMLPSPAWIHQWTGCQSFSCVWFGLSWFCFGFACSGLFCVSLLLAWLWWWRPNGPIVQVLPSSLLRPQQ